METHVIHHQLTTVGVEHGGEFAAKCFSHQSKMAQISVNIPELIYYVKK